MSVTFDGPSKLIVETATGGDNTITAAFIYSRWKEWVRLGDNAKFDQALRVEGGAPFTATQLQGSYFFTLNGWKIRPSAEDHKLTVDGNIVVDGGVGSIFSAPPGGFSVHTETTVSPLAAGVATNGATGPDAAAIADAVWDELLSGHAVSGSAGAIVVRLLDLLEADVIATPTTIEIRRRSDATVLLSKTVTGGNVVAADVEG